MVPDRVYKFQFHLLKLLSGHQMWDIDIQTYGHGLNYTLDA